MLLTQLGEKSSREVETLCYRKLCSLFNNNKLVGNKSEWKTQIWNGCNRNSSFPVMKISSGDEVHPSYKVSMLFSSNMV